eukprot:Pgem_evm1s8992
MGFSEYERQRQVQIAKNKEIFKLLELEQAKEHLNDLLPTKRKSNCNDNEHNHDNNENKKTKPATKPATKILKNDIEINSLRRSS